MASTSPFKTSWRIKRRKQRARKEWILFYNVRGEEEWPQPSTAKRKGNTTEPRETGNLTRAMLRLPSSLGTPLQRHVLKRQSESSINKKGGKERRFGGS